MTLPRSSVPQLHPITSNRTSGRFTFLLEPYFLQPQNGRVTRTEKFQPADPDETASYPALSKPRPVATTSILFTVTDSVKNHWVILRITWHDTSDSILVNINEQMLVATHTESFLEYCKENDLRWTHFRHFTEDTLSRWDCILKSKGLYFKKLNKA